MCDSTQAVLPDLDFYAAARILLQRTLEELDCVPYTRADPNASGAGEAGEGLTGEVVIH